MLLGLSRWHAHLLLRPYVNRCPFTLPACSVMAPWLQSLALRAGCWEAALGPQPSGPEASALVRVMCVLGCGCGQLCFAEALFIGSMASFCSSGYAASADAPCTGYTRVDHF